MKLVGTVEITNRLAHYAGFGASSKVGKACKGVLQIRNKTDGKQKLVLSTNKELVAFECDVEKIQLLRTKCIHDGLTTIEVREPPMNIMLRGCKPDDLQAFVDEINKLLRTDKNVSPTSTGTKTSSSVIKKKESREPETEEENEKPGTLRKYIGRKRARSPELSKAETSKIKKYLQSADRIISVRNRENYPKEIPSTVEKICVHGIKLRKIDSRMLSLQWLNQLDLSENSLRTIDQLVDLKCELNVLNLAKNQIANLPDDIFYGRPFRSLMRLDVSGNKLTKIPTSVVNLHSLTDLNISDNQLLYLPYNWMDMKCLRALKMSQNRLSFVPATILRLPLMILDASENSCFSNLNDLRSGHVGYSSIPTLFETACEVVMNLQRQKKLQVDGNLPKIVEIYLQGGKYCLQCNKFALRYKIVSEAVVPSSSHGGALSECQISPGYTPWLVKKVICYACDNNLPSRPRKPVNKKPSNLFLCF